MNESLKNAIADGSIEDVEMEIREIMLQGFWLSCRYGDLHLAKYFYTKFCEYTRPDLPRDKLNALEGGCAMTAYVRDADNSVYLWCKEEYESEAGIGAGAGAGPSRKIIN